MNKKVNTLLFILGATLFNVITAVISFILFALFYARFIFTKIPEHSRSWGFILIFLASLAVSFMIYRFVLRFLLTKVKIEDYFDPLFVSKYRKKP
jgi:phosphoglycerol transferase MdoB-like AlkP superfamily enzyme